MKISLKQLMEALAIIGSVGGSLLVALAVSGHLAILGYCFYLMGTIASIYLLKISTASRVLVGLNFYFLAVNVIGIIIRW
jgi:hypothetical protein